MAGPEIAQGSDTEQLQVGSCSHQSIDGMKSARSAYAIAISSLRKEQDVLSQLRA